MVINPWTPRDRWSVGPPNGLRIRDDQRSTDYSKPGGNLEVARLHEKSGLTRSDWARPSLKTQHDQHGRSHFGSKHASWAGEPGFCPSGRVARLGLQAGDTLLILRININNDTNDNTANNDYHVLNDNNDNSDNSDNNDDNDNHVTNDNPDDVNDNEK